MKAFVNDETGFIERLVKDEDEAFEPERPGTTIRDWPSDLDPSGMVWPIGEAAPRLDPSQALEIAKREMIGRVDDIREHRERASVTDGYGKALAYARKSAELRDYRSMASSAAGLLAAINAMTVAQRRARFPMIQAEAEASGDSFAFVANYIEVAENASSWVLARIEARAVTLKRSIRDAQSLAALDAIDLGTGWPD